MPAVRVRLPLLACCLACCLATVARGAADPPVVAVVAVDPYADLKKQARWVGGLVDQPQFDGYLESFIMIATQFKGLAGLDVNRPVGLVVTAEGPAAVPVVRGFVPVKDLGKLLAALERLIGPAQEQDGVQVVSPPGMPPIQIVEKDGWAIVSPQGSPDAAAGLERALDPVVKAFTLGVQLFPARMPEGMRTQLAAVLEQAAAMQAQQGQPVDPAALATGLESLEKIDTLLLGVNLDVEQERVALENRFAMVEDSAEGSLYGAMAKATPSVPATATADGKAAAMSGHAAVAVPESLREVAKAFLVQALPVDQPLPTVFAVLRTMVPAMLDAGGLDATLTVDTAAAEMAAGQAMPRVTAGMRVKDGAALEANLKAALGAGGGLPEGVTAKFDAGKAGAANLHVVEIDLASVAEEDAVRALGAKLPIVLGVTPTHAFVAAGGDAEKRIAAAAGGGKADPNAKPLAGLDVSLLPLVRYVGGLMKMSDEPEASAMTEAVEGAGDLSSSLVQLLVQPIERGMATRLSADAGAIKLLKTLFTLTRAVPQPAGLGPGPVPKGRPIPLPGLAP